MAAERISGREVVVGGLRRVRGWEGGDGLNTRREIMRNETLLDKMSSLRRAGPGSVAAISRRLCRHRCVFPLQRQRFLWRRVSWISQR